MFPLLHPPRGPLCCCFWCPAPWRFVVRPAPPFPSPPLFCCLFPVVFSLFFASSLRLPCLSVSVVSRPWVPWALALCLPSLALVSFFLFVFSVFLLLFCSPAFLGSGRSWCSWPLIRLAGFCSPSPCAAVRAVRALCTGAAVRVVPCWCWPVASFALAGAVCCCLWLRAGRCCVWVAVCCFPLACFGVGGLAWPRGLPPCCVLWVVVASCSPVLCPVFCGSVLPCGGLLLCPPVRFALFCGRCCAVLLLGAVCGALCLSWWWSSVSPSCAPGCSLLGLVACLPCCLVCAGWCSVLLPVDAGCSLLGLVACCCFSLVCVVSAASAWPRGLLPCCVLWCRVPLRRVPCSVVLCCPAVPCCGALLSGFV